MCNSSSLPAIYDLLSTYIIRNEMRIYNNAWFPIRMNQTWISFVNTWFVCCSMTSLLIRLWTRHYYVAPWYHCLFVCQHIIIMLLLDITAYLFANTSSLCFPMISLLIIVTTHHYYVAPWSLAVFQGDDGRDGEPGPRGGIGPMVRRFHVIIL